MKKNSFVIYLKNALKGYIRGYLNIKSIILSLLFSAILYTPIILFVTDTALSDKQEVLKHFRFALMIYYSLGFVFYMTMWFILNHRFYKVETKINSQEYYRDILKSCTLIDLSFLDNRELDLENDIVGTTLMLQLKGKIKILNGKIIIIDSSKDNLLRYEEALFHLLTIDEQNYDSSQLIFKDDLLTILYQEGKYKELKSKFIDDFKLFSMESLENNGIAISLSGFSRFRKSNPLFYIIFLLLISATGHFFTIATSIPKNSIINYEITPKGRKIEKHLLGLKMFLNDYSNMKEKEFNEFGLWDEYMIYSVILNDNKKVKKEILEILENHLKERFM